MIIFCILNVYYCILTGEGLMIGSVSHEFNFLAVDTESTVGFSKKTELIIDPNDAALVTIIKEGDLYLIKFANGRFLYMTKTDHEVVLKELKFDADKLIDTEMGFKFDFEPIETGYLVTARGQALEITKSMTETFTVQGKTADAQNKNQWFYIKKVNVHLREAYDPFGERDKKVELAQQHEGPTLNPILHGPNTKRDSYIYGNEPYRGRH